VVSGHFSNSIEMFKGTLLRLGELHLTHVRLLQKLASSTLSGQHEIVSTNGDSQAKNILVDSVSGFDETSTPRSTVID
jgi:hypothetical protein